MGYQIIITKYKDSIVSCMTEENRIIQINLDPTLGQNILGNVYVGKVKNIVKNIKAAFVEIADGIMCYLSLEQYEPPIYIKHGNKETIQVGDELLVQVSREGLKTKAPTVTTGINLTGRYLILTGQDKTIAISKKIDDNTTRKRLKKLAASFVTEETGVILRTNAAKAEDHLLCEEAQYLHDLYKTILEKGRHSLCFSCIYETVPGYLRSLRDSYENQVDSFVTDDEELYHQIHHYLEQYQKEDLEKLHFYDATYPLEQKINLSSTIESCKKEKLWLKSGGSIIIQPTEALTVIDVNTEKSIKGKISTEEHFYKINMEAAKEISYQLRLRNITGIILIDFIDMEQEKHRTELVKELASLVKADPVKTIVVDMTALNLVELTRMKTRKPVLEQLMELHY